MIVVAPDKFKGTLSGAEVAAIVAGSLRAARPDENVVELPLADGGQGSVDLAVRAGFEEMHVWVTGPLGTPVHARYARLAETAVVEMALAAGLDLLPLAPDKLTAMTASTHGVGELLEHALAFNPARIVLGVGGSATTDGGAGLAAALGARIRTTSGADISPGAAGLAEVATVDFGPMVDRLAGVEVIIASDVDSPLLGPHGAAPVFGPQKGADPATVEVMQRNLAHWARKVSTATGNGLATMPGSGAAGGIGLPLLATGTARITSGAEVMMELAGFDRLSPNASMVVVGEGSLDSQSLRGKGPIRVAEQAKNHGATVIAVVGRNELSAEELRSSPIDRVYAMTDLEPDIEVCLDQPHAVLTKLASRVAATESGATRQRSTSSNESARR